MVIINNDDFGASENLNYGIYLAFSKNLISSTTTLVNFEEGLKDAVTYINEGKIRPASVGLHLNLTAGKPLTNKMAANENFCENGSFKPNRNRNIFFLNQKDRKCVFDELEAQILKFKEVFGFNPSHLDSHHHIHTELAILQCVIRLAKKYKLNSIRLSQNLGSPPNFIKRTYKKLVNNYLKFKKFKVVDKFGGISALNSSNFNGKLNYEIMVHVIHDTADDSLKDEGIIDLNEKLREVFQGDKWQLSNYTDLAQTKSS
ncbi:MAG: ChbG/HpnK family deacetylase [Allomuricauda sp.]|nr:MAG: ChbG/HpnK family deacetylase [Allomuricauda sp.]